MSLIVIGLNHRTVPLDVLERMTIAPDAVPKALHDLVSRDHVSEAVVLSTCNRTEIYAQAERFHGAVADVCAFLSELSSLPPEHFADSSYTFHDAGAAEHLFGVAAGLDSAVVGEHEILGQIRTAWEVAQAEDAVGAHLNGMFRHALEVGKRARTETDIGRHTTSVSQAAVAMADRRLGGLSDREILVLGAGDMGSGMIQALRDRAARVTVVNRTLDRAQRIALDVGGQARPLLELPAALTRADVVLTSTGARSIIVEHGDLAPVMAGRPDRPMLVVDVAVPRDVDPGVVDIDGVTLLDMNDLRAFADEGAAKRRAEVGLVREIVAAEVDRFLATMTARLADPLVVALRRHAEQVRLSELDRIEARLADLDDRQRAAVEAVTKGIVNTLLHQPTVQMKDTAGTPKGERLAEALGELFALDDLD